MTETEIRAAVVNGLRPGSPTLDAQSAAAQRLIDYIPFPEALRGKYQCFTEADLAALRAAGCDHRFADVASGVSRYLAALSS